MTGQVRIIYEANGFPRELTEPRDWARAIAAGSLARDTPVSVRRGDAPAIVLSAGEVPELAAIFTPAASPAAPPPPPPAPVADPVVPTPVPIAPTPVAPSVVEPDPPTPPRPVDPPARGGARPLLAIIAGLLLLVVALVAINLSGSDPQVATADRNAVDAAPANDTAPAEPGEAIAEGVPQEWTDTGTPTTYTIEGLAIVLAAEADGDGMKRPVLTVRSPDLGDIRVVGVTGGETAQARFIVLRPVRTDRFPSILFLTYSMGAHCCTSVKLLTPRGAAWTLADLGDWDGAPFETAPTDLDGDGALDFVLPDNAFLYAFASYAESSAPSLVYNVASGRFVDRSASPSFRPLHRADMERFRPGCAQHSNGACAAFVASAARLGEQASALAFAAANFDPGATDGWLPTRCAVPMTGGACPAGETRQPGGYVEALDWFLQDHGYVRGPIAAPPEPDPAPTVGDDTAAEGDDGMVVNTD